MAHAQSDRIGPTAHYTAYAWHVLGMSHAEWFATPLGRSLFATYRVAELPQRLVRGSSRLLRTLENRHRLIDRELLQAAPDCVVELGAGLSRRGVTWAIEHATRYIEIDLPAMAQYKRRLVEAHASTTQRAALAGHWELHSLDILAADFADTLAELLRGARRPVVIMEGVLGYFQRRHQAQLLGSLARALGGRGQVLADVRVRAGGRSRTGLLRGAILVATRGRGAAPDFKSVQALEALFSEAGFAHLDVLESLFPDALSQVVRASASE